jgi:hypothetical protein
MDVEKTMQFMLEMQAKHETAVLRHDEEMAEIRHELGRAVQILATHGERLTLHRERLDAQEREFRERLDAEQQRFEAFIQRFDEFLRGRRGNGDSRRYE